VESSPGNNQKKDLVNMWVFSRWWKVEVAEVTLSGRLFNVRGPTTGKVWFVGDGCRLDQTNCQMVGASWMERSAARQVGNVVRGIAAVLGYKVSSGLADKKNFQCYSEREI